MFEAHPNLTIWFGSKQNKTIEFVIKSTHGVNTIAIGFGAYLFTLDGLQFKIYRDEVVPPGEDCTQGGADCLFEVTDVKGQGFPNPKMNKDDQ